MKKGRLLFSLLTVSALMVGCNQQEPEEKVEEVTVNEEESVYATAEQETQMRLVEQGFEVENITTSKEEDIMLLTLNREGETYYAIMNGKFEWVLEPTNEIKEIEVAYESGNKYNLSIGDYVEKNFVDDGLIMAAIKDSRPRKDEFMNDGLLWGYLNTDGEWAIEPQYRSANQFSDGLAIVSTIEEDRDDLANSRRIVVDTNGKELFELYNYQINFGGVALNTATHNVSDFHNGYLKMDNGVYNQEGNFFSMEFIPFVKEQAELDVDERDTEELFAYEIINDKVVTVYDNSIKIYSLEGNLLKEIQNPNSDSELDYYDLLLDTDKEVAESNKFIVQDMLMDVEGHVVFQDDSFAIEDSIIMTLEDENDTWNFYDLEGNLIQDNKKIGINLEGVFYNSEPHWVEGNEYYELLSADNEVLISEDKKISHVSNPGDQIVEIKITDPSTLEEVEALVNINTLEFKKKVDL